MKRNKHIIKRLFPSLLAGVIALGPQIEILAGEVPSEAEENEEDILFLLEDYAEENSPSHLEEWDEEDSLPSLERWDEESSVEEEQELPMISDGDVQEALSEWNLGTWEDPLEMAWEDDSDDPVSDGTDDQDADKDDDREAEGSSDALEEASWDGEIDLPAPSDDALLTISLDLEVLPEEAAEEEAISDDLSGEVPFDMLVGAVYQGEEEEEGEEEEKKEENPLFYPNGKPKWTDGPYTDVLLGGSNVYRDALYEGSMIENGDYLLRLEGKVALGSVIGHTDFYREKEGDYYFLDVYAVDQYGFETSLPSEALTLVEMDMYYLDTYLRDVGVGAEKSIFVVYPEEDGKLRVYSSFYEEETHSLMFLTDRLGPAVLVAYENKDQVPLMESEDFLKTLHDAALSFPAEVDWRNAWENDLLLGEMRVTDGDYSLYHASGDILDETGGEGVTAHSLPGEGLYFTTSLTEEDLESIYANSPTDVMAMRYCVPFSYYEDMEKTFGEDYREKRFFALFPSSKGVIYHKALLDEEMGGFVFQTDKTGHFFLVAAEDESYIIDSEAFVNALEETYAFYMENLSDEEADEGFKKTIGFQRTQIILSDMTDTMEEEGNEEDIKIREGVVEDTGAGYQVLRSPNSDSDPDEDISYNLCVTYSPDEEELNQRFGEGWRERYTYAVFTDGNAAFSFYPVTALEDGRIRFTTDMTTDFVLVNLSRPLEDLPGMGTIERGRKGEEYQELHQLVSWLRLLPAYREIAPEGPGGNFALQDLSTEPSGAADIVDMPVLIFDDEDLEDLSVERADLLPGGYAEGSFIVQLDVEAALRTNTGEGEGEGAGEGEKEEGGGDKKEESKEKTLSADVPLAMIFHPLPKAYGYYTLKGEGFPQRVSVFLEKREELGSYWGLGWEKRPLYALYMGKDLETTIWSESEEEIQRAIEKELAAYPCEYDSATGEVSFEANQEGDYCFVSIQEEETPRQTLFQERARELAEQVRLQPKGA